MKDKANVSGEKTGRRWFWFVGLYVASLAVFTLVVYLLRWLIH